MAPELREQLQVHLGSAYRLEGELGGGGMSLVFLARDVKHDRLVALKILRPELAAALGAERFLREIRITAKLNHPHILPLLDSGDAAGLLYYVMPYVAGESLRDRLDREKQLPLDDALQITREVADALQYAHSHDVVHRDIKPENILLESGHAVVADFGIARAITAAAGERVTETGIAVGSPAYMSPEQSVGEQALDGRTDIYSLGCVLYEMLAGEPPHTGPSAQAIFAKRLQAPPPRLSTVRDVPAPVAAALTRALARAAADRFPTAHGFAVALTSDGAAVRVAPHRPGWRLALFGIAGVVAIGGALLVLRSGRAAPTYGRSAIAVLPFQNLSAEVPYTYFAGGLHEEILTQLSKVAALKVISRTSVMGYEGTTTPLRRIASELGVGSVVEGSVQVVGGRLRVNVQLIDAATDALLWAERYDRTLNDAFAIQSDVAQQIVVAVGAALSGPERHGLAEAPTANAEAYRLYLQGREYATRPGFLRRNFEAAQHSYERALVLDPGFALAHGALSEVHGHMYQYRFDPSPARAVRQREEAEAALRLAPDLPEAHVAMGLSHYWGRGDTRRALDEFRVALKGRPNDARLWVFIGSVQRRLGNWDEVLATFEKATQLKPKDPDLGPPSTRAEWQVRLWYWGRQADSMLRAIVTARVAVFEAQTRFLPSSLYAAWAHQLRGDSAAARAAFDSARVLLDSVMRELPDDWRVHAARGLAVASRGRRDEALGEARWLQQSAVYREDAIQGPLVAEDRARILAQAGEADAALDEIERLLARPSWLSVHMLRLDPANTAARCVPIPSRGVG